MNKKLTIYNIDFQHDMMKHTYIISGMSCQGCKSHVTKALENIPDIEEVEVDLDKGTATISMKKHIEIEEFQQALKNAGGNYQITMPSESSSNSEEKLMTHSYHVSGMSCNGCRSHVEKALSEVEGVAKAAVNLEKEEAEISMHHHIEIEKFQQVLKNDGGGYEIHPLDKKKAVKKNKKKKICCNGSVLPGAITAGR